MKTERESEGERGRAGESEGERGSPAVSREAERKAVKQQCDELSEGTSF